MTPEPPFPIGGNHSTVQDSSTQMNTPFEDATSSWSFAESDTSEVLDEEILKLLRPCPGTSFDDQVIAWQFMRIKCLFWREDSRSWHRLTWASGQVGIDPVSPSFIETEAIDFVARLDEAFPEKLFQRRCGSSVVHLARRVVKVGKIYSKPGVPGYNQTEEFVRGWLTKVKHDVAGNRTAVPLRTYVTSDDIYRLYRVFRAVDTRSEKAIRTDLAGAIRTVFAIGRSNNLPNPKTGKPTIRGWWGLDFAKALPQGFHDEGVVSHASV